MLPQTQEQADCVRDGRVLDALFKRRRIVAAIAATQLVTMCLGMLSFGELEPHTTHTGVPINTVGSHMGVNRADRT